LTDFPAIFRWFNLIFLLGNNDIWKPGIHVHTIPWIFQVISRHPICQHFTYEKQNWNETIRLSYLHSTKVKKKQGILLYWSQPTFSLFARPFSLLDIYLNCSNVYNFTTHFPFNNYLVHKLTYASNTLTSNNMSSPSNQRASNLPTCTFYIWNTIKME